MSGINSFVCKSYMYQVFEEYYICKACSYMMSGEQPGAGAGVLSVNAVREKTIGLYAIK